MPAKKVAVVGAVNIDICGTPDEKLVLYDSNPGINRISYGGVGRNIAENLCKLGVEVHMITVLADDVFGRELEEYSSSVGIDFTHSMRIKGASTSTYLSINDKNGDMIVGTSDMDIYSSLSVDFISTKIDFLNSCDAIVCDTNIPQDVIEYIANNVTSDLIADPVSTKKAEKLINVLDKFTMIKPNMFEAQILSGVKIENDDAIKVAAEHFHGIGVKYVFVSLGEDGVVYSGDGTYGKMDICNEYQLVNASGCGDSFIAAVIWSFLNGDTPHDMALAGECAACICGRSVKTVCDDLTVEHIKLLMEKY